MVTPSRMQTHIAPVDIGSRLAVLEDQMRTLLGNGQPGIITKQDNRIRAVERINYIGIGIIVTLQFLSANGLLNIRNWLK